MKNRPVERMSLDELITEIDDSFVQEILLTKELRGNTQFMKERRKRLKRQRLRLEDVFVPSCLNYLAQTIVKLQRENEVMKKQRGVA